MFLHLSSLLSLTPLFSFFSPRLWPLHLLLHSTPSSRFLPNNCSSCRRQGDNGQCKIRWAPPPWTRGQRDCCISSILGRRHHPGRTILLHLCLVCQLVPTCGLICSQNCLQMNGQNLRWNAQLLLLLLLLHRRLRPGRRGRLPRRRRHPYPG